MATAVREEIIRRLLVERGLVTPDVMAELRREQASRVERGEAAPLARIVIQRQLVGSDDLADVLRESEAFAFVCQGCNARVSVDDVGGNECPRCGRGPLSLQRIPGRPSPQDGTVAPGGTVRYRGGVPVGGNGSRGQQRPSATHRRTQPAAVAPPSPGPPGGAFDHPTSRQPGAGTAGHGSARFRPGGASGPGRAAIELHDSDRHRVPPALALHDSDRRPAVAPGNVADGRRFRSGPAPAGVADSARFQSGQSGRGTRHETASPEPGNSPNGSGSTIARGAMPRELGPYELVQEIGRGGMGVVFKARQVALDRDVALKVLLAGPFASEQQRKRFKREAEIASRLRHPAIVPILDFGIVDGLHYLAMNFVEGRPLTDLIRSRTLDMRAALRIAREVALGLHHAHKDSVIHRDVKPANILIDADGRPHITDFGLARRIDGEESTALTQTGKVIGTPFYMSPEQTQGRRDIGAGTDVYSLGVVLFEMLAYRRPFEANSSFSLIEKILNEEPPALDDQSGSLERLVDREVNTIVQKALAKDPDARYRTARELAEDIDRYLRGDPILARPENAVEKAFRKVKRHKAAILAAAASALVALLVGLTVASLLGPRPPEGGSSANGGGNGGGAGGASTGGNGGGATGGGTTGGGGTGGGGTGGSSATEVASPAKEKVDAAFREVLIAETTPSRPERVSAVGRALEILDAAFSLDPEEPAVALLRARAHRLQGKWREAADAYRDAYELDETCTFALYQRSRLLLNSLQEPRAAIAALERLAAGAPPLGTVTSMGAGAGHGEAGGSSVSRSLVPPFPPVIYRILGDGALRLFRDRDREGALARTREAQRISSDCEDIYLLEMVLHLLPGRENFDAALDSSRKALQVNPRSWRAMSNRSEVLALLGQHAEALDTLQRALVIEPGSPKLLRQRSKLLGVSGRFEEAAADLARAIEDDPLRDAEKALEEQLRLADYYRYANANDRAIAACETARRLAPASADPWVALSRVHGRSRRFDLAVEVLQEALRTGVDDLESVYKELFTIYKEQGTEKDVDALVADYMKRDDGARAENLAGLMYALRGELEKAHGHFEEAIRKDPTLVEAYQHVAKSLWDLGRKTESLAVADRVIQAAPSDPEAWLTAALIRNMSKDLSGAIAAAEKAVRMDPEVDDGRVFLSLLYMQSGRPADAEREVRAALRLAPDDPNLLIALAQITDRRDPREAERLIMQAAMAAPDKPGPLGVMAIMYIQNRRYEEGLAVAERALRLSPQDGDLHATKGMALFRMKQFSAGRDSMLAAEEHGCSGTEMSTVYFVLGLCEENLGNMNEAHRRVRQALKSDPEFEPAQRWLMEKDGRAPPGGGR